jgi:hypothetical protein
MIGKGHVFKKYGYGYGLGVTFVLWPKPVFVSWDTQYKLSFRTEHLNIEILLIMWKNSPSNLLMSLYYMLANVSFIIWQFVSTSIRTPADV